MRKLGHGTNSWAASQAAGRSRLKPRWHLGRAAALISLNAAVISLIHQGSLAGGPARGHCMVSDNTQNAVFAFLADRTTHSGDAVKRIDTHAAAVFLAGDRALKVKRAVRFPFLDYSTLNRRKAACAAELDVNRAFAPDIYRGVVAITREADGRVALAGKGAPVEWAGDMRRFDVEAALDRLAERGGIELATADALARVVAKAHAAAPGVAAAPWIAALSTFLGQNA